MTDTELKLIASAAINGDNNHPVSGYKTPAAIGIHNNHVRHQMIIFHYFTLLMAQISIIMLSLPKNDHCAKLLNCSDLLVAVCIVLLS